MTGRTADNSPQDIASALVCGHNSVGNHEGCGTHMIRHDTDGNVPFIFFLIFLAGNLAYPVSERANGIHVKNGIYILNHRSKTLQSHAGIDVFLLKLRIIPLAVIVKLGKYVVPHFNISVAVAAYGTARLAAAVLLASVIVNLRAGAARA